MSLTYMNVASANCLELFKQEICCAFVFAHANAGSRIAARIAIIAITTSNSIKVNPRFGFCFMAGCSNDSIQSRRLPVIEPLRKKTEIFRHLFSCLG